MPVPRRDGPSPEVEAAIRGSYRLLFVLVCLGVSVFFGYWIIEIVRGLT